MYNIFFYIYFDMLGSSAETPNLESQVDAGNVRSQFVYMKYYFFESCIFYCNVYLLGSSGGKRKGRGKAKGVTLGHGLEVKIYQGR